MAEAMQKERMQHTGRVLSLLHNVHRDPAKTQAKQPWHFFPALKPVEKPLPGSIEDLKIFLPEAVNGQL